MHAENQGVEMRTFIRHPSDIPIEILTEGPGGSVEQPLNNVSVGGLAFTTSSAIPENSIIRVKIPLVHPTFEARGKVAWCREEDGHFDVGIEFVETQDGFRIRMVEQICHIEHYKKEVQEKEGRMLSGKEAALEWISKYAGSFQTEVYERIEK
jgi:hypothetical protein